MYFFLKFFILFRFKLRYHPDENYKRRDEQNKNVIQRLNVFMELLNKGWLENLSLEIGKSKEIQQFLDACVIKLEGGSDEDITRLLDPSQNTEPKPQNNESNASLSPKTQEQSDKVNSQLDEEQKACETENKGDDTGSESGAYTDSDSDSETKSRKKKSRSSKTNPKSSSELHRTASIFMPKLSPSVCKVDLENLCKQYEGFKRVALSDPAPERGFYRRGWITFESNVDVKKICWDLQNIKVKDSNPGAIVNREIASRIRPIVSIAAYQKSVAKADLKHAMKIIQNMDKKWKIWQPKQERTTKQTSKENEPSIEKEIKAEKNESDAANNQEEYLKLEESGFSALPVHESTVDLEHSFYGPNPLLENITDYLVDETNAEENELLGDDNNQTNNRNGSEFEIDKHFLKALDKLILYLRVVHSIDFYNSIEYQQEDSMPNRLGIVFVRPAVNSNYKPKNDEIEEYVKNFESKIKPYVDYREKIELELARRLGLKDRKEEIEKFIQTNTQELAPDRWLCPLSGKRFKGPEFIRKHLFYKHMEKIIDVKKEVEYFNNYLMDPKRPQLAEHPSNKSVQSQPMGQNQSQTQPFQQYPTNQSVNYTSPGMMNQMAGYQQMRGNWTQSSGFNVPDVVQNFNQSAGFNSQFGYQGYQSGFKKNFHQVPSQQNSLQRRGYFFFVGFY